MTKIEKKMPKKITDTKKEENSHKKERKREKI